MSRTERHWTGDIEKLPQRNTVGVIDYRLSTIDQDFDYHLSDVHRAFPLTGSPILNRS